MPNHWEQLPDKGPHIDFHQEQMCIPYKKPKKKHQKSFILLRRYIGPKRKFLRYLEDCREWHTYKKYATEKSRDMAFAAKSRNRLSYQAYSWWEYKV